MRHTTAVLLTAVLATACSTRTPVGFYDSVRVVTESAAAHAALDGPDQVLRQAQAAAQAAQDAAAHADEVTAAAKKADADKTLTAFNEAKEERLAAGRLLDDKIGVVVAKIAIERRMTMVFGLEGKPPFAAPGTDVTDDLIAQLDGSASELAKARGAAVAAAKKVQELEKKEANAPPATSKKEPRK